jgi:hypothetical protein
MAATERRPLSAEIERQMRQREMEIYGRAARTTLADIIGLEMHVLQVDVERAKGGFGDARRTKIVLMFGETKVTIEEVA